MNWITNHKTSKVVGEDYAPQYEGGHCEHLKEGDKAFGESAENDSWGSEYYLYCEPCWKAHTEAVRVQPEDCGDCGKEFPRNTMTRYVPYIMDGSPSENEDSKRWICQTCKGMPRHLDRLANDEEEYRRDQEWMDQDAELFDDEDNHGLDLYGKGSVQIYSWSREKDGIDGFKSLYSQTVQKVSVVNHNYRII